MEKVTGIGGFFFPSKDPEALARWYRDALGIDLVPPDYDTRPWQQEAGTTVFAPFTIVRDPATDKPHPFMLNFRVRDLDAMIRQIEATGSVITRDPEDHPNGRFAWTNDPDGNPIELWEPHETYKE